MEEQKIPSDDSLINFEKIFGYILLTPPLLSVLFFIISVFSEYDSEKNGVAHLGNLGPNWTGDTYGAGGGYMSAAPIYLGLMAIAGAIMVTKKSNKTPGG